MDSEELLSEVMMKIYTHCEKIEGVRNTEAWLITIARNTIYDFFRERQKQLGEPIVEQAEIEQDTDLTQSLASCVPSLLKKLPNKYAQPLIQYEMNGISQRALAVEYGMSESGLKSRVQRGRKMLKELFIAYCGQVLAEEDDCEDCNC